MNEKELAEIEARAEAATLGPWDIGHEAPPLYAGNSCITAKLGERMAIIFEANHNFDLDNSAVFIAHARQDVPALCAEVRRLTNLVEALAIVIEDETGMLSDAPLTVEKLEVILHTLKGQRDYAAESVALIEKEAGKQEVENIRLRAALELAEPFLREEITNPDNYNCAYCDDEDGNHHGDCRQLVAYLACKNALKGGAQ